MKQLNGFRIEMRGTDAADVFIYGTIGMTFWEDGVTAKTFADELKAIGKVKTLNVFINSVGGNVFDAVAIYNQLRRNSATIAVEIDGLAASAASIVAMAGDTIGIAENGFVMIHDPVGMVFGTADDMRKSAKGLDTVRASLLQTYVARTGGDSDDISQMMADETWMSGADAVEKGFADTLIDAVQIAAFVGPMTSELARKEFRKIPDALAGIQADPHSCEVHPAVSTMRAKLAARKL